MLRLHMLPQNQFQNIFRAQSMLIMVSLIKTCLKPTDSVVDKEVVSSLMAILKNLDEMNVVMARKAQKDLDLDFEECFTTHGKTIRDTQQQISVDQRIDFPIFKNSVSVGSNVQFDSIQMASGMHKSASATKSTLDNIVQLTGYSEAVYAEAYVIQTSQTIFLDVLVVNQTSETLRNLALELNGMGGLKIHDKPASQNMGPHGFLSMKASFKVSNLIFLFNIRLRLLKMP